MKQARSLVLMGLVACVGEAADTDPFAGLNLSAVEALRIGSPDDPEIAFTWFRQLEVGPAGTIYTAHPQEHQIRMHDPSGAFLGTLGREGEGPGEFSRLGTMGLMGDTLWVLDHGTYRFSFFDLAGNLLGSRRIPVDLGETPEDRPAHPRGLLRSGSIRGSPSTAAGRIAGGEITQQHIVRLDSSGGTRDTLASFSVVNTIWEITNNEEGPRGFGSYRSQPFSDAEMVLIPSHDMVAVRVVRSSSSSEEPTRFSVTKWRIDGDTVYARTFPYEAIPLRMSIVDSIIDGFAESVANLEFLAGRATKAQAETWAREGLYLPEYHPPVSAAQLGTDGKLWLRAEELGEMTVRWRMLSVTGDPLGVVELPSGFRMLYARGMQVWGAEQDELDVPYIVRYRIGAGDGTQ